MTSPPDSSANPSPVEPSPWVEMAAGFAPVLAQAAGAGAFLCAVNLDLGQAPPEGQPTFAARLDRATRTLAFVSGEARDGGGALIASATAVFRRE